MNDIEAIHKVSHKIKSSSQLVGARGLTHLLVELENEKNLQKVATLKEQIDLSAINLKKNINEYINYK
jgi:HPt (histidine-containing phosphotransfer) domain-containing protein